MTDRQAAGDIRSPQHFSWRFVQAIIITTFLLGILACRNSETREETTPAPGSVSTDASEVVSRYLAQERKPDSAVRMRVKIIDSGTAAVTGAPSDVELALYSKRTGDGGRLMFVQFVSPPQERDRDSLVTISQRDEVEGIRYVQSNDSFLTTKGVTSEDALFGMTIQEIADGQPEKYDFALAGEQSVGNRPVYKIDGKLKAGAESKFPRLVLLIAKDNYAAVGAEFYDNHNQVARRVTVEEIKQVEGQWTRMRWTLDNAARGKRLEFQTIEARYQNVNDSIFTREHLKKVATK